MVTLYKNKGEWAELYLLFYILGNGYINIRDPLGHIPDRTLPIECVICKCSKGLIRFQLNGTIVQISLDGNDRTISQYEFLINAEKLKNELSSGSGTFSLSAKLIDFMQRCGIDQPTAKSLPDIVDGFSIGGKCDILLKYRDPRSGKTNAAGFSIKSAFAGPATLQNGSYLTNFEYELHGLNQDDISRINSIHGHRKRRNGEYTADIFARCQTVVERGAEIFPNGPVRCSDSPSTFELNLTMIDSDLPTILSDIIQLHYFSPQHPTLLSEMPMRLAKYRPIHDERYDEDFYQKKIKDYLYACFAGMIPTKQWTGHNEVNGGYLIIEPSFDVSACLSVDSDGFKEYLLQHTRLEHADCGKKRCDYGTILIGDNGIPFLRLNLQIRFIDIKRRTR